MNSQLMCSNIGHGDKRVREAIKKQADTLEYAGPSAATEIRAELGRDLAKVTPRKEGGGLFFLFCVDDDSF